MFKFSISDETHMQTRYVLYDDAFNSVSAAYDNGWQCIRMANVVPKVCKDTITCISEKTYFRESNCCRRSDICGSKNLFRYCQHDE